MKYKEYLLKMKIDKLGKELEKQDMHYTLARFKYCRIVIYYRRIIDIWMKKFAEEGTKI